jgi:hypothetical protein
VLDLPTAAGVVAGAVLVGLCARRLVDTLDALIAEQRTTNELLREQLHRRGNARDVLEALRSAPVDLDGRDVVDLDYSPTRGVERP